MFVSYATGDPEPDATTMALTKIASHIGSARKFAKASGLLRQLLASGTLRREHGPAVFAALRASMPDPSRVKSCAALFASNKPWRALGAWKLWAFGNDSCCHASLLLPHRRLSSHCTQTWQLLL